MAQSLLSLHLLVERQNVIGGYFESRQTSLPSKIQTGIPSDAQGNQNNAIELIKQFLQNQAFIKAPKQAHPALRVPPDATWSDIAITLDETTVDIWCKNVSVAKNVTYKEFGFQDQKRGKPNIRWHYLLKLAQCNCLEPLENDSGGSLKKQVSELRHDLRSFFKISDDPFHPFAMGGFYTPKFKIRKKHIKTGIKGIEIETP